MTPALAIEAASTLRGMGYNPIPSHPEAGHPIFPYSKARDSGLSEASFNRLCLSGSTNVQVATGTIWGLAVLDVDGEEGREVLGMFAMFNPLPVTPCVVTPRDGRQFWFKVPPGTERVPNVDLWKGEGHNGIEILGDGKLAKCPPSYKTIRGECVPYRWAEGRSLAEVSVAEMPAWLLQVGLDFERASRVKPESIPYTNVHRAPRAPQAPVDGRYDLLDVQASLSEADRVALARDWGLRIVHESPNAAGWIPCHSIRREDRNPSARFHPGLGCYCDKANGETLRFFALGVALGAFSDINTAINHTGNRFRSRRAS